MKIVTLFKVFNLLFLAFSFFLVNSVDYRYIFPPSLLRSRILFLKYNLINALDERVERNVLCRCLQYVLYRGVNLNEILKNLSFLVHIGKNK